MKHWVHTILGDATRSIEAKPNYLREGLNRVVQLVESLEEHAYRTLELEEISYNIGECNDLGVLSNLMLQVSTAAGFQDFSIFLIHQGTNIAFDSRICTSYNQAWIERYMDKSYQYTDPVLVRASKQDGSFLFSELDDTCPIVHSYWDDAERYNIGRNGVCFALTRREGARIGVVFTTSNSVEKTKELVCLNGRDLEVIASIAADRFCRITFGLELSIEMLSPKELGFLYKLATCCNSNDNLSIIHLFRKNTALQASIKAKLNVKTLFQAVSLASSKGWFNQVPYRKSDVTRSYSEPAPISTGHLSPIKEA